jgi:prepilin-type N-terminal cleavage/methylation domain-containing protein
MIKRGFTLAETLVALAIVGVVAALTIPTLSSKSQNQAMASKVSVTVNSLENALTSLLSKEGENDLSEIGFAGNPDMITEYLKVIKSNGSSERTVKKFGSQTETISSDKSWELKNGTWIYMHFLANSDFVADVYIDVNGDTQPNKIGRDIFKYDGILYPAGSSSYLSDATCSDTGYGCTYRLVSNGYKVDY